MRSIAIAFLLFAAALALGQRATVKVTLPAKGEYHVWFVDAKNRPLGDKTTVKDISSTEVKVPDGGPVELLAEDTKKGNTAVAPYKDAPVVFTAKDFKYAGVKVMVEHEGKPVASAIIHLKDAEHEQKQLLSPEMKGAATFEQVRLGKVVASVEYQFQGAAKTTPELHTAVEADRTEPTPTLSFSIPDKVATVGPEQGEKGAPAAGVGAPSGGGTGFGAGAAIVTVLALLAAAAVLYGILRFVQARHDWVKEKMDKLGVQLPGDPSDAADAQATHTSGFRQDTPPPPPLVPEGSCPYCGQTKGQDGSCGCTLSGGAAATAVASAPAQPRLLGLTGPYAGRPFDAVADQITVGRDPDNNVSLDQDTSVSRHHARLVRQGGALMVEDLGSTNGTFVNGTKVAGQQALSVGDRVQFGESQFKYEA